MIILRDVSYSYPGKSASQADIPVLTDISISIRSGEFVAIIGKNGSGKTTIARMMNALLLPGSGTDSVMGIDTRNSEQLWKIRAAVGMVFQNIDNQIIASTVEEDVAFGPENLGLPPAEIECRIREALEITGLVNLAKRPVENLSNSEKQFLALAGLLGMKPACIILDESTALMDADEKEKLLNLLHKINYYKGITIILITQNMDDASLADRIIAIDKGRLLCDGTPDEVFSNRDVLIEAGLKSPQLKELFDMLNSDGFHLLSGKYNMDEAVRAVKEQLSGGLSDEHSY